MSDVQLPTAPITPAAEGTHTVREASMKIAERRGEQDNSPEKPVVDVPDKIDADGTNRGADPKDLARALTDYRERKAQEKSAVDVALGVEEKQPTVEQRTEADTAQPQEGEAVTPEQEARNRATAEWERAKQITGALSHGHELAQMKSAIQARWAEQFPDIRSNAELQYLSVVEPERAQEAVRLLNAAANVDAAFAESSSRAIVAAKHQFNEWAKGEDDAFMEANKELQDPKVHGQIKELMTATLKEVGLSYEEMKALYTGDAKISLRDRRTQQIMFDALRWRAAKARAAEPAGKPVPKVSRPGVSEGPGASQHANIQSLTAKLSNSGSLRDATNLLLARRAAGRAKVL